MQILFIIKIILLLLCQIKPLTNFRIRELQGRIAIYKDLYRIIINKNIIQFKDN